MAHVSQKKLSSTTLSKIDKELVRVFEVNRDNLKIVISELLTETERLMIAKRLAVILLLARETSYYRISKTLAVSTSTIKRLHRKLLNDDFPKLEKLASVKKQGEDILDMLETILQAGMPPRGRGRWRFLSKK